jgi:uncharacterized repeat protein (TIGR01451 family)
MHTDLPMQRAKYSLKISALTSAFAVGFMLSAGAAQAAGTRAGTVIDNTATATFDQNGTPTTVNSNTNSVRVDELIDTVVDWSDTADVPTSPGATGQVLRFGVTNTGNGVETFSLAVNPGIGGDQYDPTSVQIVIDDGDGVYEPGQDTIYVPGPGNPALNPDQTITVFLVSTTPGGLNNGDRGGVRLTATSTTGTGAPGTSFPGQGEGGNAVIGTSGGDGSDDGYYAVTAATVTLAKSATVRDPFGGTTSVPGSIITYTLLATVNGGGSLANLTINDAIPTGTTYVAGSIRLGGTAQTDAADTDASSFASNAVAVALGTVPAGQTRTVTFQVTIN